LVIDDDDLRETAQRHGEAVKEADLPEDDQEGRIVPVFEETNLGFKVIGVFRFALSPVSGKFRIAQLQICIDNPDRPVTAAYLENSVPPGAKVDPCFHRNDWSRKRIVRSGVDESRVLVAGTSGSFDTDLDEGPKHRAAERMVFGVSFDYVRKDPGQRPSEHQVI